MFRLRGQHGYELAKDALKEWLRRGGKPARLHQDRRRTPPRQRPHPHDSRRSRMTAPETDDHEPDMTGGEQTFRALQAAARSTAARTAIPAPTQEYLTRHLLESFLDRLGRTSHADGFVLKGGILLTAYGARRPPRTSTRTPSTPTSPTTS